MHLAVGDVEEAQAAFDRAASLRHGADIEVSLVRTYMQAGEYRRALAFGAHAAGAHSDFPAATALYAWLLYAGGQDVFALRLLDNASAIAPSDGVVRSARERLGGMWPVPDETLLAAPTRVAPYAQSGPAQGTVVGSAMLIDGGRAALAPGRSSGTNETVWLRNGLGQTTRARSSRNVTVSGLELVVYELDQTLSVPAEMTVAPRRPFAGSPGYTVEYAPTPQPLPAWPLLRKGFIGRGPDAGGMMLGIDVPPGPRGGPVFDAAGRVVGIATTGADGHDRVVPVELLRNSVGEVFAPVQVEAGRIPADQIYERALRLAVQVIIEPAA